MDKNKIARINELAKKSKTVGLTDFFASSFILNKKKLSFCA